MTPAQGPAWLLLVVSLMASAAAGPARAASPDGAELSALAQVVTRLEQQLPPLEPVDGTLRVAIHSVLRPAGAGTSPSPAAALPTELLTTLERLVAASLQARYAPTASAPTAVLSVPAGANAHRRARRLGASHLLSLAVSVDGGQLALEATLAPLRHTLWDDLAGRPVPLAGHMLASAPVGRALRQLLALPAKPELEYRLVDLGPLPLGGPIVALAARWGTTGDELEIVAVGGDVLWLGRLGVGERGGPAPGSPSIAGSGRRPSPRTVATLSLETLPRATAPCRDPVARVLFVGPAAATGGPAALALGHSSLASGHLIELTADGLRPAAAFPGLPLVVDPARSRLLVDSLLTGRNLFSGKSRWVSASDGGAQASGPQTPPNQGVWPGPGGSPLITLPNGRTRPVAGAGATLRGVGACAAVADLDGDGAQDVLSCSRSLDPGRDRLRSRRHSDGGVLWSSSALDGWIYAVAAVASLTAGRPGVALAGLNRAKGGVGRLLLLELR